MERIGDVIAVAACKFKGIVPRRKLKELHLAMWGVAANGRPATCLPCARPSAEPIMRPTANAPHNTLPPGRLGSAGNTLIKVVEIHTRYCTTKQLGALMERYGLRLG